MVNLCDHVSIVASADSVPNTVSGEWKSLVDSVNQMAGNLTDQVRSIAKATVRRVISHLLSAPDALRL